MTTTDNVYYDIQPSNPIFYPEEELVDLGGFSFTQSNGIVLKTGSTKSENPVDYMSA